MAGAAQAGKVTLLHCRDALLAGCLRVVLQQPNGGAHGSVRRGAPVQGAGEAAAGGLKAVHSAEQEVQRGVDAGVLCCERLPHHALLCALRRRLLLQRAVPHHPCGQHVAIERSPYRIWLGCTAVHAFCTHSQCTARCAGFQRPPQHCISWKAYSSALHSLPDRMAGLTSGCEHSSQRLRWQQWRWTAGCGRCW